jgi:hypothetical protein
MTPREFLKYHLLKVLLVLVAIQLGVVAFIQNYNHRPVALEDRASVFEGHKVSVMPLSNDSDKDEQDEISLSQITPPVNGTLERKGNTVYYSPNDNFYGVDSFPYTISDGRKESKPAYMVIEVKENLNPVAHNDEFEVYSGGQIMIDLLGNDEDREGDSIQINNYSQPKSGKLIDRDHNLFYVADNLMSGIDSFSYTITDGKKISDKSTVTIVVKSKNDACYPWLSLDIGNAALKGGLTCQNKSLEIKASGADIWNEEDGFHFAYQFISGDCEMVTRVDVLEGSHEWAKAGLMIRETLSGGSKDAFVCISGGNGVTYHQRLNTGDSKQGGDRTPDIKAPYWLKIKRAGNSFMYYSSADGKNWKKLGEAVIDMSKDTYIGFAVTSHNNEEIAKAVFSRFKITGMGKGKLIRP